MKYYVPAVGGYLHSHIRYESHLNASGSIKSFFIRFKTLIALEIVVLRTFAGSQ